MRTTKQAVKQAFHSLAAAPGIDRARESRSMSKPLLNETPDVVGSGPGEMICLICRYFRRSRFSETCQCGLWGIGLDRPGWTKCKYGLKRWARK